jgi:hypothetical protein
MSEWINLTTGKEVFDRQAEGWEIEFEGVDGWYPWKGITWSFIGKYRGRPKQPKPRIVTSECWRNKRDGSLIWDNTVKNAAGWQRFPVGDLTGEVADV